jgi:predicted small secreted protein
LIFLSPFLYKRVSFAIGEFVSSARRAVPRDSATPDIVIDPRQWAVFVGQKGHFMHSSVSSRLLGIFLLSLVPLLSACHTTAGAGEDISQTGQAIEKSADKHTP